MHQEDHQGLCILHIDHDDQLPSLIRYVRTQHQSLLLVLPSMKDVGRQAFTQAEDFHELASQEHAQRISFVIPEKQSRQWARESGFLLLFSSLEDAMAKLHPYQAKLAGGGSSAREQNTSSTSAPVVSPFTASSLIQTSNKQIRLLLVALCVITMLVGSFFLFIQQSTPLATQPAALGDVSFQSSRIYNQDGTSGISNQIQLMLQHLAAPNPGHAYYAWLLSDKGISDARSLFLGKLSLQAGRTTLSYTGPPQSNLLLSFSQFLITEEDATIMPIVPSPDQATWRYSGMFAQTPNPSDEHHYSLLDHLRHVLASDPTLEQMGLHGGLNFWQYKQCSKLIEWTQSARDDWGEPDTAFMKRQLIRTLDYLDGAAYVSHDVAPGTPLLVDFTRQRIGLLDLAPTQALEGYFPHIAHHITSLVTSPGATSQQKQRAGEIIHAINGIVHLLQQAHQDAKQLLALSDTQLHQSEAQNKLDELSNLTTDAYSGHGQQQGCTWVHQQIEQLAVFHVQAVST